MANFGQLIEKLLEGFAQGQVHKSNVAERGGDYRLKDQEAAFGKLRGLTNLSNEMEDRGRADRQRTASAKAILMVKPEWEGLDNDTILAMWPQEQERLKMEREERHRAAEEAKWGSEAKENEAQALEISQRKPKYELPPELQEAEAQARIKAHLRGPAGPQPKSPEEIAYLIAQTRNANASADQKGSLAQLLGGAPGAGTLPAGAGVLSPGGCPEGKTGNKGAVVCRGGQWVANK